MYRGRPPTVYRAARRLNGIKHDHGLIDDDTFERVGRRIDISEVVLDGIDESHDLPAEERATELDRLNRQLEVFGEYSICGEDELSWGTPSYGTFTPSGWSGFGYSSVTSTGGT